MTFFRLMAVAALLLVAAPVSLHAQPVAQQYGATPQFDWFEYEGRDPLYERYEAGPGQYLNPIMPGFYPDPSFIRVGEDYYMVHSSFSYFPGVPIFHSRDLVNWTQIGNVLDRPEQLPLDDRISRGIFAPGIAHHDGVFYVITTNVSGPGNFYVTATDPAGPWSDPVPLGFDGIDPTIFFDEDGRAYVTNNGPPDYEPLYSGHRAIWIQELDYERGEMIGERKVIVDGGVDLSQQPIWIEKPHIFRHNGYYYMICAEGGTGPQHSEVVFRSTDVMGPYEPWDKNPILTQRHLDPSRPDPVSTAGHADFLQTPDGAWWAVFLATRPYEEERFNIGRETFLLPVTWTEEDGGWPVILEGDATVPYVLDSPGLPEQAEPAIPHQGNFTVRDDFDGATLPFYWHVLRTPQSPVYGLVDGNLTLPPRSIPITRQDATPAFVGRRQQHHYFTATTSMRYQPTVDGERAGMVTFQNETRFFGLFVAQVDGQPVLQLERSAGEAPEIVAQTPLNVAAGQPVYLRVDGDGPTYRFSYATTPGAWTNLGGDLDGRILSTQDAGGFVGTFIGLHSYQPEMLD